MFYYLYIEIVDLERGDKHVVRKRKFGTGVFGFSPWQVFPDCVVISCFHLAYVQVFEKAKSTNGCAPDFFLLLCDIVSSNRLRANSPSLYPMISDIRIKSHSEMASESLRAVKQKAETGPKRPVFDVLNLKGRFLILP